MDTQMTLSLGDTIDVREVRIMTASTKRPRRPSKAGS
jgi:hypothetical protein